MPSRPALLAPLLLAASVEATVLFHNPGARLPEWREFVQHNGTVKYVTAPSYSGNTAIEFTQINDPTYTERYHSEVVYANAQKLGDEGYYGFAFFLPPDWNFVDQTFNIGQFMASFPNDKGCEGPTPSTMIWVSGDKLYTRLGFGTICGRGTLRYDAIATVRTGVWHTVVIHAKWTNDNTGFFQFFFDGAKVVDQQRHPTTYASASATQPGFGLRLGQYANGWHDDPPMKGSQPIRKIYLDQIGAGTTYADADPNAWGDNKLFALATATTGRGTIATSPKGANFVPGTKITLTAAAASGWTFQAWSGSATGTKNPIEVAMSENRSVTATFVPLSGLAGYTYAAPENGMVAAKGTQDIAFGSGGKFVYLLGQTKAVACNAAAFGKDPNPGVDKFCFTKSSTVAVAVPVAAEASVAWARSDAKILESNASTTWGLYTLGGTLLQAGSGTRIDLSHAPKGMLLVRAAQATTRFLND